MQEGIGFPAHMQEVESGWGYLESTKGCISCLRFAFKTVWPSGLRRWLKAPFRKGVGSNPTAVSLFASGVLCDGPPPTSPSRHPGESRHPTCIAKCGEAPPLETLHLRVRLLPGTSCTSPSLSAERQTSVTQRAA